MPGHQLRVIQGGRSDDPTEAAEAPDIAYPSEWERRTCAGCDKPITGPRRILVEAVTVTNFLDGTVEHWHGLCRTVHETRKVDQGRRWLADLISSGGGS